MSSYYQPKFLDLPYNPLFSCFIKEKQAINRTHWWLKRIEGYEKYVPHYPEVKCEPLEMLYEFYRDAGKLDPEVLTDCINFNYRTNFWALWLVLITPYPRSEYTQIIKDHLCLYDGIEDGMGKWFPELVILYLEGKQVEHDVLKHAARFRELLSQMPKIILPLRLSPTEDDEAKFRERNNTLRDIYKNEGSDAALLFLKANSLIWDLSYEEWLISLEIPTM